jgi:hypothetical protein
MAVVFLGGLRARAVDASDVLAYSIGPVRLHPRVSVGEQYNDNIFYRSSHTNALSRFPVEDDFITTVSPGITMQMGRLGENHLSLDYTLDKSWYADHSDQGHLDHFVNFGIDLHGNRITLTGTDRFQYLSGILGGGQNLGQRVNRFTFNDDYRVDYRLGEKTGLYVSGGNAATDYEKGTPLYDERTLRATGGFDFKATDKTGLFGELYYAQSKTDPNQVSPLFPNQPRLNYFGGFVGVRGDFTTRLSGSIKAGYETRFYSNNGSSGDTPVVEVRLENRFSDRTTASLTYARRSEVSVQSSVIFGSSYTSDTFGLSLRRTVTSDGKLVATVGGTYENNGYDAVSGFSREDQVYRANAALAYSLQLWLTAKLAYQFEKYASNDNLVIDYTVNSVTLTVSVGY